MDAVLFRRAAASLSTPQGMALVSALSDGEWRIASQAADRAEVHVSTATKHLSALHEAGVLQRRETKAQTGRTYAYRLPSNRIVLVLNLENREDGRGEEVSDVSIRFITAAVDRAESLGWKGIGRRVLSVLRETFPREMEGCPEDEWETCLRRLLTDGAAGEERIVSVLRAVRATFENALGPIASEKAFLAALEDFEDQDVLKDLSADLFHRGEVAT